MSIARQIPCFLAAALLLTQATTHAASVQLDELDLSAMSAGWGQAQANQSISRKPLRIGGMLFARGVGTHAESECFIQLDGQARKFSAKVGVDDSANNDKASLEFAIFGDGRELWKSGVCRWQQAARDCQVDLAGVKSLELVVTDAGDGIEFDHADWAEAAFEFDGAAPKLVRPEPVQEEYIELTPPAPPSPRINGPRVYGVRPGSPFLYRIPATGDRPMTFHAVHLPAGLTLDSQTGIITGRIAEAGEHRVTLKATNPHGEAKREFRVVAGPQLALTPPMGWNSWYIHYDRVTEATLRNAADQMVATGMADYGYQYVNIDDCWMVKPGAKNPELGGPPRDAEGRLLPNKRFPDIRGMVDSIHAKGLKAGIYISPGPTTCAGFEGSWQHEAQDALTFAGWGFDFLKYDWCSYGGKAGGNTIEDLKRPYQMMWTELQKQDRDIVFNLCQYGMGDVWKWGGGVGNCWRTTGDLGLEHNSRLPGFYRIGLSNAQHWEYVRPGAWNDPDYILIGWVGDARGMGVGRQTTLTPNEQYSYMSLWSMMAAPLVFSGDMAKLDSFTLNVLCNAEVIEVNQDPLGRQARILRQTRDEFVLLKELEDGSKAVGLFNLSSHPRKLSVNWEDLGMSGAQSVRDVWRQKELGSFARSYESDVPRHGVAMITLRPTHLEARPKVVAYVPNWINLEAFSKTMDYSKLTHVNIAFENPVDDLGNLSYNPANEAIQTKAKAAGVKVLVSIGGGGASGNKELKARYFKLLAKENRPAFVNRLATYLDDHGFDGIDVDIEGPSINDDYGGFIADLSAVLKPKGKILTAALSQGYGGSRVPADTLGHLDFLNIMAYDATGTWDANKPGQHSSMEFAKSQVAYWTGRGLPPSKAVLGVPFYGYGFGEAWRNYGYPYSEIVTARPEAARVDETGSTIYYNGIPTIRAKARYVLDRKLGGVMIWSLDQDAPGKLSLLTEIHSVLQPKP